MGALPCRKAPLFWGDEMDYMTISEAAEKWSLTRRRIQTLCATGRIPGTERFGSAWMIPKDAVKPADARIKSGKYVGVSTKYHKECTSKDDMLR